MIKFKNLLQNMSVLFLTITSENQKSRTHTYGHLRALHLRLSPQLSPLLSGKGCLSAVGPSEVKEENRRRKRREIAEEGGGPAGNYKDRRGVR